MKKICITLTGILLALVACNPSNKKQKEASVYSADFEDKEVVCFVYHRFGDQRYPSTNVAESTFEAHLSWLKKHGYQVLTFSEAIDYLKSNSPTKKTAVITIDDGYSSFHKNGLPLLKKYGFPATLFINTETVGGSDYMGWSEIKDAARQGIEIGNHSHSHQYFLNLAVPARYTAFKEELIHTQSLIKRNIGTEAVTFAYPYGEMDAEMVDIVRQLGFKAAAAQNSGVIHRQSNLFRCPRFPMSEFYAAPEKFASKATMKALKVTSEKPYSFILPDGKERPKLVLTFDASELRLDDLQCFIQGSECKKYLVNNDDGTVTLTIQSNSTISSRRRTLYTVTVPGQNGRWHWFSHLWVNPSIK